MLVTRLHVRHMSMIQIRNVPEKLHRELKVRAAGAGMTLSDFLLDVIRKAVERPEPEVLLTRIRERAPVYAAESPADAVRAERDAR
jgi:antitoxin FitA